MTLPVADKNLYKSKVRFLRKLWVAPLEKLQGLARPLGLSQVVNPGRCAKPRTGEKSTSVFHSRRIEYQTELYVIGVQFYSSQLERSHRSKFLREGSTSSTFLAVCVGVRNLSNGNPMAFLCHISPLPFSLSSCVCAKLSLRSGCRVRRFVRTRIERARPLDRLKITPHFVRVELVMMTWPIADTNLCLSQIRFWREWQVIFENHSPRMKFVQLIRI